RAVVDPEDAIEELSEEDNNYTIRVTVEAAPQSERRIIDFLLSTPRSSRVRETVPEESVTSEVDAFIERARVILGSEIDLNLSAKDLKPEVDLIKTPTEIKEDCILVGGPVANPTVRKYRAAFPVRVTNEYPGKHRGVIQVIKIDGHTVVLLAGSDRWGTKAAVEYFKTLNDLPEEPVFVEWRNGRAVRIGRP
ncbi:MAG TPA: S-layer protein, partial [Methanothermococcus okinawensis]|nr:S-layer protein [Methanothermococcus okinawensis]